MNGLPRLQSQTDQPSLGPSSLSVLAMLREFGGEGGRLGPIPRIGAGHHSRVTERATTRGNFARGAEVVGCEKEAALILMGYHKFGKVAE